MNEARNNPNAQAKEEGKKSGFSTEINDIAVIVKLAEIGLAALKFVDENEQAEDERKMVEELKSVGQSVIVKFMETAKFLYEKSHSQG